MKEPADWKNYKIKPITNYKINWGEIGIKLFKKYKDSLKTDWFESITYLPKDIILIQKQIFDKQYINSSGLLVDSIEKYQLYVKPEKLIFLTEKDFNLFEVITDRKRKVYFDIDKYHSENLTQDEKDNYLEYLKKHIESIFPNCKFQISGYKTDDKISYHIVLSNYHFNCNSDNVLIKSLISDKFLFDTKAYPLRDGKARLFKCINQSKATKNSSNVQKYIEGSIDRKDHFVTYYFDDDSVDASKLLVKYCRTNSIDLKIIKTKHTTKSLYYINDIPQFNYELDIDDNFDFKKFEDESISPWEIFTYIPNPKREANSFVIPYSINWVLCAYSYKYDISFEKFWDWCRSKDSNISRENKYKNIYNGFNDKESISLTRKTILRIVERFYPDCLKGQDFRRFKKMHEDIFKMQNIKYIDGDEKRMFLNVNDYLLEDNVDNPKFIFVNVGMGGNKTGSVIDYLKETLSSFVFITNRISLALSVGDRIEREGIKIYMYNKDFGKSVNDKRINIPKCDQLMIEIESIHYIDNKKFDVIVIDEVESVLNSWVSVTHSYLYKNWYVFNRVICNSKKVIMMDAFLSMKTFNYISNLNYDKYCEYPDKINKNYIIISRKQKNPANDLILIDSNKNTIEIWLKEISDAIKSGKNIYVFYPFCRNNKMYKSMEEVKEFIIKSTNINMEQIDAYHGNVDDIIKKKLNNVNENWIGKKCILTNTCITVGVNFDLKHFDSIYAVWADFIKPRDLIQSCYRIRTLNDKKIYLTKLPKSKERNSLFIDMRLIEEDSCYKQLINDINIEERAKYNYSSFKYLCELANFVEKENIKIDLKENVKNEIDKLFESIDNVYDYFKIFDVFDDKKFIEHISKNHTPEEIEIISKNNKKLWKKRYDYIDELESKIWSCQATMNEKLIVDKFNFKKMFEIMDDEIISRYWSSGMKRNFVDKMRKYLTYKCNIIKTLENEMECSIFEIIGKDFKLSNNLKKRIKDKYDIHIDNVKDIRGINKLTECIFGVNFFKSYVVGKKSKSYEWKIDKKVLMDWKILSEHLKK